MILNFASPHTLKQIIPISVGKWFQKEIFEMNTCYSYLKNLKVGTNKFCPHFVNPTYRRTGLHDFSSRVVSSLITINSRWRLKAPGCHQTNLPELDERLPNRYEKIQTESFNTFYLYLPVDKQVKLHQVCANQRYTVTIIVISTFYHPYQSRHRYH